ncbi:MAG: LysR family transcriptional regulator [Hyphomicrobiales bacterium]|nr:LysR family transcriptional regulator [Hyphomicrobiales bacterium]
MKQIDFTTLRVIALIAETGSLSASARQYSLTLAAISKRLLDVEAMLKVSLFERTPKGVVATDAGRAMVAHARQLLYEFDRMQADLSSYRSGETGTVRVGGNTSAMTQFLPEQLSRFSQRYPAVRLDLAELSSDGIVARLADGRLDVGVFSANAFHEGLEVRPYFDNRLCAVARADTALARRKSVPFSVLLEETFVGLESDSALMHLLHKKSQDRPLKVSVQVRSFDVVCRFVQAGVGIGVLPIGSARFYARSMGLATVPLADSWAAYTLLLGTRSVETLNAASRLLFRSMAESVAESKGTRRGAGVRSLAATAGRRPPPGVNRPSPLSR